MTRACLLVLMLSACTKSRAGSAHEPGATAASAPLAAPAAPARPPVRSVRAPAGPGVDPASEAVLRQALDSTDFGTRLVAIDAIAAARYAPHVEWLAQVLGDPEPEVRLAAVEALKRFSTTRARQLLRSVRDDDKEDLDIRATAASALLVVNQ